MDEIIIEDKKYVSSKRAAKETGYAKDYVGQLCREGRIPARLIGRNWYVLESAIQDHRFGMPETAAKAPQPRAEEAILPPTWQSARYETEESKGLPSVNLLKASTELAGESTVLPDTPQPEISESIENIQDTWQDWFKDIQPIEPPEAESEEVSIAIQAIYHPPLAPREPLPVVRREKSIVASEEPVEDEEEPVSYSYSRPVFAISILVLVGFIAVSFAVLGSGYLDKSIASYNPVSMIAGVSVYNK